MPFSMQAPDQHICIHLPMPLQLKHTRPILRADTSSQCLMHEAVSQSTQDLAQQAQQRNSVCKKERPLGKSECEAV